MKQEKTRKTLQVPEPPIRALVTGKKREMKQIKNTASNMRAKALLNLIPFSMTGKANPKGRYRESIKY